MFVSKLCVFKRKILNPSLFNTQKGWSDFNSIVPDNKLQTVGKHFLNIANILHSKHWELVAHIHCRIVVYQEVFYLT